MPGTTRRGTLVIEKVDGDPVASSTHFAELIESGFVNDYRGVAAEAFG